MSADLEPEGEPVQRRRPLCDCGKACFGSEGAAKRNLRAMQQTKKGHGYEGRLHAYFCRAGRAWHVGHR